MHRFSPQMALLADGVLGAAALTIESLDGEGRGVARSAGKVVFVEGALPGETVTADIFKKKPTFDLARVRSVLRASPDRVVPRCPHFGVCGGCTLQHAGSALQIAAKQRTLEDALERIGRLRAERILPPIEGPAWGYRFRARLSVRHVPKKGGVLVGFHERKSSFVADMRECHVLPKKISDALPALRELVGALTIRDRLPQIEVAVGERPGTYDGLVYVLVLRILAPLATADARLLAEFSSAQGVDIWLQTGGPDTAAPLHPTEALLAYQLPEFAVTLPFAPTEFTQVNSAINRVLVRRAVALLDPRPGEQIVDFFCGLGNFTLPIARSGATALGIEGNSAMVRRAQANALANGLAERAQFRAANLANPPPGFVAGLGQVDRVLIDPPREGAIELVKTMLPCGDADAPTRIVYIACNPATLARDAAVLVHDRRYRLTAAGVVNMFPHTAHVESITVFDR